MKIRILNITKRYATTLVLEKISLEIQSEKLTTLLGLSGCGKTTLLRCIAGLEIPDEGEIYFDERCVFSSLKQINLPTEKRNLGFVFQDFALWPHLNVFENVAFGLRARKDKNKLKERVEEALQAVQLQGYGNRRVHELSGGQQQRVAFARALAVNPSCILFDEPLSALDAVLREQMRQEVRALVTDRSMTAIFVTHDQQEAMSISDEIVVMNKGTIEMQGSPQQIYSSPSTSFVAMFVGKANWFDSQRMLRPEQLGLQPKQENSESLTLPVIGCIYLGNCYQIVVQYEDQRWLVTTDTPYSIGDKLTVYFDEHQIIVLKEKFA